MSQLINEIRELELQRNRLAEEAKEELMETVAQAIEALASLGYEFSLVSEKKNKPGASGRNTRKVGQGKNCSICQFKTEPAHDARQHKSQSPKMPFTQEELEEKGLRRIDQNSVREQEGPDLAADGVGGSAS